MAEEKKGAKGAPKEAGGKDAKESKETKDAKGAKPAEGKEAAGEAKPAEGAAPAAPKPKAAPKAPYVPKKKKEAAKVIKARSLKELVRIASTYPTVGIVDVSGIPAANMMQIRGEMRTKLEVRVAKKTLIKRALEESGKQKSGLVALLDSMGGQPGLMGSTYNPFKAYMELDKRRTRLAARGGEKAPDDIVVHEGATAFKPGPVVGELQKAGIPAAIDQGKVMIKSTKTVVRRGEVIGRDLALALAKLEIKPLEVKLAVRAVFDGKEILKPDVLAIDENVVIGQVVTAQGQSLALALEIGWAAAETITPLLQKAHYGALQLAVETGVITKESLDLIIQKAAAQAVALGLVVPGTDFKGLDAGGGGAGDAGGAAPEKKEERKEEKKVSEEDAAAGLSSLFG
jgi:large subunit ribosomal protein L10